MYWLFTLITLYLKCFIMITKYEIIYVNISVYLYHIQANTILHATNPGECEYDRALLNQQSHKFQIITLIKPNQSRKKFFYNKQQKPKQEQKIIYKFEQYKQNSPSDPSQNKAVKTKTTSIVSIILIELKNNDNKSTTVNKFSESNTHSHISRQMESETVIFQCFNILRFMFI